MEYSKKRKKILSIQINPNIYTRIFSKSLRISIIKTSIEKNISFLSSKITEIEW